ncbi:TPA: hypothetical protein ACYUTM_004920 [Serratia marcescens]|uniref:hypothetical protein n=1 Tax=Serratia sp. TMDUHS_CL TaxID=3128862 RepID=UPI0029D796BE|nr:hypothetical protein [Serratia marcescens]BEM86854.1 hypothetical protein SME46J_13240 [Serratia marcescens]BEM87911.1 hypothetical protein SME46J_23810 [Serratia marcescens]
MSEFAAVLNDMRDHFKNNIKTGKAIRYSPKVNGVSFSSELVDSETDGISFFVSDNSASLSTDIQDRLQDIETHAKVLAKEEASHIEDGLEQSTKKLTDANLSTAAKSDFSAKLAKLKEDAQKKALNNIDKIFNAASEIGEAHPEAQNTILFIVEKVGNLFHELVDKIVDFIVGIVQDVVKWIKNAWDSITTTFNGIKTWVSLWF